MSIQNSSKKREMVCGEQPGIFYAWGADLDQWERSWTLLLDLLRIPMNPRSPFSKPLYGLCQQHAQDQHPFSHTVWQREAADSSENIVNQTRGTSRMVFIAILKLCPCSAAHPVPQMDVSWGKDMQLKLPVLNRLSGFCLLCTKSNHNSLAVQSPAVVSEQQLGQVWRSEVQSCTRDHSVGSAPN